jgi:hypothetical protein
MKQSGKPIFSLEEGEGGFWFVPWQKKNQWIGYQFIKGGINELAPTYILIHG